MGICNIEASEEVGIRGMSANKSRHRMSGNNINLKFDHQDTPLIGALHRWTVQRA